MNAIDNGGPAMPVIPPVDVTGRRAAEYPGPSTGLSLRDWFATHAPLDIPTWFVEPEAKAVVPAPVDPIEIRDARSREKFANWAKDPAWDLAEEFPALKPYVDRQQAHWTAKREAARMQQQRCYIAWRWTYADLMIAARSA